MLFNRNDKRQNFSKNRHIVQRMVNLWETADETSPIDVLGSYTGVPYDADDPVPEQDADDL